MSHTSFRLVMRCAVAVSGLAIVGGCATAFGLPQRRPGSNITLPQTTEGRVLRALLPCEHSVNVGDPARAVVECNGSALDPTPVADPQRAGPTTTP